MESTTSSNGVPMPTTVRPVPVPRARPVIELNLNVEEAMIEAVDLLRTIRVQLEAITGTVNERLNRTFSDAGEDVTKIIHNVETLSSNLAVSTGQLYQPVLFSLLSLLVLLILLATFFCLICRIRKEMKGRRRQKKSRSSEKQLEEAKPLKEGIEEGENGEEEAKGRAKRRKPFGWFRRFRSRPGSRPSSSRHGSRSPELEELREKVHFHEAGTLQKQENV